MMKDNRGVTLLTMGIAIIVMLIIASTITFNVVNHFKTQKLDNLYNDLKILSDKMNIYYNQFGKLPVKEEYTEISKIPSDSLNPNDYGKYYKIDLNAIPNLSLSTAIKPEHIYVINEGTHTIYFPAGVELDGKIYYRLPVEYTKVNSNVSYHYNIKQDASGRRNIYMEVEEFIYGIKELVFPDGTKKEYESNTKQIAESYPVENTEQKTFKVVLVTGETVEITVNPDWENSKIASSVTETSEVTGTTKERTVPIPKGFTASQVPGEDTIAGGLVIYQTETPVTEETHDTALTEYDQYVWIPVDDINQMVMCKSNTGSSICDVKLQSDGTVKCTNPAHVSTATDLCGRFYMHENLYTSTNMNFADRTQTWNYQNRREPDIASRFDEDDSTSGRNYMELAGIADKTAASFSNQLINDFKNMAASVAKYGGFYVGRYEIGENGVIRKNQKALTAASYSSGNYIGVNTWYGLYGALHQEIKSGLTTIAQSHMIYGSQYDQIINFIGVEAQTSHIDDVVSTQSLTGSKETDKLKNIYDLQGNNYEATAQTLYDEYRIQRGGYAHGGGNVESASASDDEYLSGTNWYTSGRPTFYF